MIALTTALAKTLPAETGQRGSAWSRAVTRRLQRHSRQAVVQATPLKRIGTPNDIAQTVVFLVEGSDFITGAIIPVDGGRVIA